MSDDEENGRVEGRASCCVCDVRVCVLVGKAGSRSVVVGLQAAVGVWTCEVG